MKNRRNLAIVVILILFVGFFFYKRQVLQNTKKVESTRVKRGELKETLTLSGNVDADERVILRFPTSGRLAWVGVKKGDYVKKYQVIATLDQRSVKKQLQKELNDFSKTRLDLDQNRDNNKSNVITDTIQRILDKSQFDVSNAVLDVELQDLAIEFSRLVTPIEGIVTATTAPFAGVNIAPTQAEFEIINPKTIFFVANADQTEVTQLSEGLKGELILDSYADVPFDGTIDKIAFTPTPGETGTVYAVKFIFTHDVNNSAYRVGMTGDVTFTTKSKQNVLYLPIKFIKEENDKKYVFVMKEGKQTKRSVKTGLETDTSIEITSGLSEGNVIYD